MEVLNSVDRRLHYTLLHLKTGEIKNKMSHVNYDGTVALQKLGPVSSKA